MQLNEDTSDCRYQIQACDPGLITINGITYNKSLVLSPETLITDWGPRSLQELTAQHLETILKLKPEIILLGTGKHCIIPPKALLAPIYKQKLGVECMDTAAACRTFIALSSEGRHVVAGLISV